MVPVLTLAIPNYNGARYLEQTLQSLEANRPYVRWWLQDSCSTDESVAIAERYRGTEDRIVVEKDAGQADGLNRAFARMGGEIVGYLNSDDLLAPGAAKRVLEQFESNPETDLVHGELDWIDMEGRVTGHHAGRIESLEEVLNIYEVWWAGRQWVQPEVFWRRGLADRVGPFRADLDLVFDFEYWVRCFAAGARISRIEQTLCQFRLHPAQKSARAAEASREMRQVVADRLARHAELGSDLRMRLEAALSYDAYRLGEGPESRAPLGRAILRHPEWLRLQTVRTRLRASLRSRLPGNPRGVQR